MVSISIKIGVGLLLFYVVMTTLAWKYQERLAFPAPRSYLPEPEALGLGHGKRVTMVTADGVELFGWYLPPDPPATGPAPGVLWFHGNMETVDGLAPILKRFRPPGMGLLVIDYRGYGESKGSPTEDGLYQDAEAAWEYLASRPEIDSTRIAVYGRSLGSAVATRTASTHKVRAVVLDSPFTDAREMARRHYAIVPGFLLRLSLDNSGRIGKLDIPILIVHGDKDRIAPIDMGRKLARSTPMAELMEIPGAGHNDTYDMGGASYVTRFRNFLVANLGSADSGKPTY